MSSSSLEAKSAQSHHIKSRYFMTWRWHFYAGLFVIPFLLILSLTGLIMLFDEEIEFARYESILAVEPEHHTTSLTQQMASVNAAFPDATITQFSPARSDDTVNRYSLETQDGRSLIAAVNPYSGTLQGTIDRDRSVYQWVNRIHANLLIGDVGDRLLEIAASLGILLVVTGVALWWPNDHARRAGFLTLRLGQGRRVWLRDLHANLGGVLSLVLLFFLISGLAWTGIWGAKLTQAWNTFPTYYTWGEKPNSQLTHQDLNPTGHKQMPWNLEQTPLPQSEEAPTHDHANMATQMPAATHSHLGSITLDEVVEQAHQLGFTRYHVYLPLSEKGVYTIAANSMNGDNFDPRQDRTLHLDQYSGTPVLDVTWQDYTIFAKWMAASVSLHQGDVGLWNKVFNVLFCLITLFLCVSGTMMWWIRRPQRARLGVPPTFQSDRVWKVGLVTLFIIGLLFPLGGMTILVVLAIDALIIQRVGKLRQWFQ